MDYSSYVKGLTKEVLRVKSYSRLNPVLRVILFILMLPFTVLSVLLSVIYCVLVFVRNACAIPADELEIWLNKKKDGEHFIIEAVIYLIAIPFVFTCRVLLSVFSLFFYFVWFFIMVGTYVATLGGVRWQPYLNSASYDKEYAWTNKNTKMTLNVYAIVSSSLAAALAIWNVIDIVCQIGEPAAIGYINKALIAVTSIMIYVVYPLLFAKKDCREISSDEDIYAEAVEYTEVNAISNCKRARKTFARISEYKDSEERIKRCDGKISCLKSDYVKALKISLIALAALVLVAVLVFVTIKIVHAVNPYNYIECEGGHIVSCRDRSVEKFYIPDEYKGKPIVGIADGAFSGCKSLEVVIISKSVTRIGEFAFSDCVSLKEIKYCGTEDEWETVEKEDSWDVNTGEYTVKYNVKIVKKEK